MKRTGDRGDVGGVEIECGKKYAGEKKGKNEKQTEIKQFGNDTTTIKRHRDAEGGSSKWHTLETEVHLM